MAPTTHARLPLPSHDRSVVTASPCRTANASCVSLLRSNSATVETQNSRPNIRATEHTVDEVPLCGETHYALHRASSRRRSRRCARAVAATPSTRATSTAAVHSSSGNGIPGPPIPLSPPRQPLARQVQSCAARHQRERRSSRSPIESASIDFLGLDEPLGRCYRRGGALASAKIDRLVHSGALSGGSTRRVNPSIFSGQGSSNVTPSRHASFPPRTNNTKSTPFRSPHTSAITLPM